VDVRDMAHTCASARSALAARTVIAFSGNDTPLESAMQCQSMMLRFDHLIRPSMTIREVKIQFPQTVPIFDELAFRAACDDCSIEVVARRQGLTPADVVDALNRAVLAPQGDGK